MPFPLGRSDPSEPTSLEPIAITPIAVVRNRVREGRSSGWQSVVSDITLTAGFQSELLTGLDEFSHLLVVFWIDRLGTGRPRPDRIKVGSAEPGVLATRSQLRPNPIGVSVVRLQSIAGKTLRVVGLDAIDGTPVLDVKPYLPYYDSVSDAKVPGWVYGA
jgi:tRNA-Thr(GGU) m(6)t(6)A37 methyltransferase TsaA